MAIHFTFRSVSYKYYHPVQSVKGNPKEKKKIIHTFQKMALQM